MNKFTPLTVAIPTFNRSDAVHTLVRSLLPQLSQSDELLVVDDCSSDQTSELLKSVSGMRLERHSTNQGMVKNWNSCFELATNDWICIIHDDDIVSEDAVATVKKTCATIGKPALIAHPLRIQPSYGGHNYRIYSPGPSAVMASALSPSGAVVHKSLYEHLGGFDERFRYSADVEYFARLATRYDLLIIDSPVVVAYQLHADNYQYETWRKPDFWPQWEEITRTVLSYTGFDKATLSHMYKEQIVGTLRYIMETSAKRRDAVTLRKYGRIALNGREYGKRLRLQGLVAATLGRYI